MDLKKINENVILKQTLEFSLLIVKFTQDLQNIKAYVIANQLLKSGTSIGANAFEAQNCESRADFIHKLKISAKECNETTYWLLVCKYSENYPNTDELFLNLESISKILNAIISTSKVNQKRINQSESQEIK